MGNVSQEHEKETLMKQNDVVRKEHAHAAVILCKDKKFRLMLSECKKYGK